MRFLLVHSLITDLTVKQHRKTFWDMKDMFIEINYELIFEELRNFVSSENELNIYIKIL